MSDVHACPGCGKEMPTSFFLCLQCADQAPDVLIVAIGTALDEGQDVGAAYAINEAADLIGG